MRSFLVLFLWFQESHRKVRPAACGHSAHRLGVRTARPTAGAQQLHRLDRESLLIACCWWLKFAAFPSNDLITWWPFTGQCSIWGPHLVRDQRLWRFLLCWREILHCQITGEPLKLPGSSVFTFSVSKTLTTQFFFILYHCYSVVISCSKSR